VFLSRTGRLICLDNQLPHFLGPRTHPKNLKTQQHPTQAIEPFPQNYHVFFWEWLKADSLIMGFLRLNHQPDEDDNPFTFFKMFPIIKPKASND